MIEEDYVSFEIAKLLKEKGFDEGCKQYWYKGNIVFSRNEIWNRELDNYEDEGWTAPTLQMAMKWLREEYNLNICFIPSEIEWRAYIFNKDCEPLPINAICGNTYEEACEAVIRYILENLI